MTKKEIENIAWELCRILECAENDNMATSVANKALMAIENISKKYPEIKEEIKKWMLLKR